MRKSLMRDESGMAMLVVIMALLVISLLSTAAISMASSNIKTSLVEREFQSSFYIAEAGATYYMEDLRNDIVATYNGTTTMDDFYTSLESGRLLTPMTLDTGYFQTEYGYQPEAEVTLQRLDLSETNPRTYALVSLGQTDNVSRTVLKQVKVKWHPRIDLSNLMSVFSMEQVTLTNGTIIGPIGTNFESTDDNAIQISGNPKIDDYYLGDSGNISAPSWWLTGGNSGSKKNLPEPRSYPLPEFPEFPSVADCHIQPSISHGVTSVVNEYTLTSPITYIPSISVSNAASIRIKFSEKNCKLLVDDFNVPDGTIYLEGSGTLKLYVRGNFYIKGFLNPPLSNSEADIRAAVQRLAIHLKGTGDPDINKELYFANESNVYGSMFGEDANITIDGSAKVVGNIITGGKKVEILGGTDVTTQVIYAPNADVRMLGSGTVIGPVISKTFYMEGGAKVHYDPTIELITDPFLTITESDLIPIEGALREK